MKRPTLLWGATLVACFVCFHQERHQIHIAALSVVQSSLNDNFNSDQSAKPLERSEKRSLPSYQRSLVSLPPSMDEDLPKVLDSLVNKYQDGTCTLSRNESKQGLSQQAENAIFCTNLDTTNFQQEFDKLEQCRGDTIHQVHVISSKVGVARPLIGAICKCFECSNLKLLNITSNIMNATDLGSIYQKLSNIETLDISNTTLDSLEFIVDYNGGKKAPLDRKQSLRELRNLYLDYNQINELDFDYVFKQYPKIRVLSLSNNNLTFIHGNATLAPKIRQLEILKLGNNSFQSCGNDMLWLMELFLERDSQVRFPDSDRIRCASPENFNEMTWRQRWSVLQSPICEDCDCRSLKKNGISVDCHNRSLVSLPDSLPANTKVLNLTSNQIGTLVLPKFSKNWDNVTYIYLEDNMITSIKGLHESDSKFTKNLAALDLRKNKLEEIPFYLLEHLVNLDQVYLSDNPWLCECAALQFQGWLQRHFHKVADKEGIICAIAGEERNGVRSNSTVQRLAGRVLYRLPNFELCPQPNAPLDWLDVAIYSLSMSIILVITKTIVDYYYQKRTTRLPRFFRINC